MPRPLTPFLFAGAAAALLGLGLGCNASVTEGCIGGVCEQGSGGSGSTSTGTGTGGSGGTPLPTTGDFPCDVFAIIHEKCNPCHTDPPQNGAPFPILTYEDVLMPFGTHGKLRYQRMAEVIDPTSGPYMPLMPNKVGVTALSDAQMTTLAGWLADPSPTAEGEGCECPGKGCD